MATAMLGSGQEGRRGLEMRSEISPGQGKEFYSKRDKKSLEDF